jgi:hypothetical protein
MDKSRKQYKNKDKKPNKFSIKIRPNKRHNSTMNRGQYRQLWIPYTTPPLPVVNKYKKMSSYSPTINKDLVTLASIPRENIQGCNLQQAYQLKEPLKIELPNRQCVEYYTPEAEKILLKNLKANKHVITHQIVPPMQSHGNCWFNAFFVTFFVSDKGRKFFHFLRQLMIKGTQKNKTPMPANLRNAFALLNFGIDSCLRGNDFAYELDTNSIIVELFKQIPANYKESHKDIVNIDDAGNPVLYYMAIINYLNNNSIQFLFFRGADNHWKEKISEILGQMTHLPHFIVMEFFEEEAKECDNKAISFKVNNAKYALDSAVVRDIEKEHFCAAITCEGKEMGYDGMSFHRLTPFLWKHKLNSDVTWKFEGSNHADETPMQWNFRKSYQMLLYYRVE